MTYKSHVSMAMGISTIPLALPFYLMLVQGNSENIILFKLNELFLNYGYKLINFYQLESLNQIFLIGLLLTIFYFFIFIGSLFPDIDHNSAKLNKWIKSVALTKTAFFIYLFVLFVVLKHKVYEYTGKLEYLEYFLNNYGNIFDIISSLFVLIISFIFFKIIGSEFKHRGPTHSYIYQGIGYSLIVYFLISYEPKMDFLLFVITPLLIGSVIHVFSDTLTKSGVAFLAPIFNKRIKLLPKFLLIETGSDIEFKVYFIPFVILFVINVVCFVKYEFI